MVIGTGTVEVPMVAQVQGVELITVVSGTELLGVMTGVDFSGEGVAFEED